MGIEKIFSKPDKPDVPDESKEVAKQEANRRRMLLARAKGQGGRQTGTLGNPDIVRQGLSSRLGGLK